MAHSLKPAYRTSHSDPAMAWPHVQARTMPRMHDHASRMSVLKVIHNLRSRDQESEAERVRPAKMEPAVQRKSARSRIKNGACTRASPVRTSVVLVAVYTPPLCTQRPTVEVWLDSPTLCAEKSNWVNHMPTCSCWQGRGPGVSPASTISLHRRLSSIVEIACSMPSHALDKQAHASVRDQGAWRSVVLLEDPKADILEQRSPLGP